jgi:hypothetical protein
VSGETRYIAEDAVATWKLDEPGTTTTSGHIALLRHAPEVTP